MNGSSISIRKVTPKTRRRAVQVLGFYLIIISVCSALVAMHKDSFADQSDPAANQTGYFLVVLPSFSPKFQEGRFAPIAAELGKALNRDVRFRTTTSFEKFKKDIRHQTYEIIYLHPFDYVEIARGAGYTAVAKRNGSLSARIVVKPSSPILDIMDLKHKLIGFPPEDSAVSYLVKIALQDAGFDLKTDVKIRYFNSHSSGLQHLAIGDIDACGAGKIAIESFETKMNTTYRLVAGSPTISQTLFAVHKRVPEKERAVIQKTLLTTTLAGLAPEYKTFFPLKDGRAFQEAKDEEYEAIRDYAERIKDR